MKEFEDRFRVAGRALALLAALLTTISLAACVAPSQSSSVLEETTVTTDAPPVPSLTEITLPEDTTAPTPETSPSETPSTPSETTVPPVVTEPPATTAHTSPPPAETTLPPTPDPSAKGYYGYGLLSESERVTYQEIAAGIEVLETEITLSLQPSKEEFFRAFYAVMGDNPLYFHLPTGFEYAVNRSTGRVSVLYPAEYLYTADQVREMASAVMARADQFLAHLTSEMTTYERVKKLHDLLILNVTYDSTAPDKQNLYGALVGGRAVCEGYAESFQYLLHRAGIQTAMVTGKDLTGNVDHAWNLVRMDDGSWYHVDTTWDDPVGAAPDYIGYNYFLVSDEEILKVHTIFPPVDASGQHGIYVNFYPLPSAPASYPR